MVKKKKKKIQGDSLIISLGPVPHCVGENKLGRKVKSCSSQKNKNKKNFTYYVEVNLQLSEMAFAVHLYCGV